MILTPVNLSAVTPPDMPKLLVEASLVLPLVLVNPPSITIKEEDFMSENDMVGGHYFEIDGGTFIIAPILGVAKNIIGNVAVVKWELSESVDGDVSEAKDYDSFYAALSEVCTIWALDQLTGHMAVMVEAKAATALLAKHEGRDG